MVLIEYSPQSRPKTWTALSGSISGRKIKASWKSHGPLFNIFFEKDTRELQDKIISSIRDEYELR